MIPKLSHLQFAVLWSIGKGPTAGFVVRKRLSKEFGVSASGPRFYQLMKRLESDGFVELTRKEATSLLTASTSYTRTRTGEVQMENVLAFYERNALAKGGKS